MLVVDLAKTGENIKRLMFVKELSYRDLQEVFGFKTPQSIFKWMRGDCLPTIDNLIILADTLGCKMDDIIITERIDV